MPQTDMPLDNTIKRMCFACWINKAIEQHSEYIMLIVFPR